MAATNKSVDSSDVVKTRESCDDSEDESEILEESPCGRWFKRREEVQQRDIPGIDAAYLAMDTDEGVEVVWNEVQFSERKNFLSQEDKIRDMFDSLTRLDHPNIVKLHKYWMDKDSECPRVIFITEYMSSGSLKQFLKKTKRNVIKLPLLSWKRWCSQILSALNYLHSCSPPIIHGNLTCDTIFIQHNGLIKICSVVPDAILYHIKTNHKDLKNKHFTAPEYMSKTLPHLTQAVDVYAFGMCALEMAALEISASGDKESQVTECIVNKTIDSLENHLQKDFIQKCLCKNPCDRATIRELLFHSVIFEVHSLKLLAAHAIVNSAIYQPDQLTDEVLFVKYDTEDVLAHVPFQGKLPGPMVTRTKAKKLEIEKFLNDVRNGIYPLTAYAMSHPIVQKRPLLSDSSRSTSIAPQEIETRRIVNIMCNVKPQEQGPNYVLTILLRMDDKMNRQLSCEITKDDDFAGLSEELVYHGFISDEDREMVANLIGDTISRRHIPDLPNTNKS
ncbi:nuclear receptor-binding protein [Parasteatoda tepidariorum]|nr:nuclear receptor-binding protein-like [Parasteatoda tepidariorum]